VILNLIAIIAASAAALACASSALASHGTRGMELPKGDLVITFSGSGGGAYRFHQPPSGVGAGCRVADTTYGETDSYHWSFRFALSPTAVSSDVPIQVAGGGQLASTEQLLQCGGAAAVTSECTQGLRAPLSVNAGDLAYPGVTVGQDGSLVTIGAVGELILSTPQPSCSGVGVLLPNPVVGYDELQAAVAIPRAQLASTGDVTRHFTMAGSGLYAGEALDGSCNSTSCDTQNCTTAAAAGGGSNSGGGSSSCSFTESYSGTIEVRVVR
jgi:hypothetical protein